MCAAAHQQQGLIGITSFQQRWEIDLKAEAEKLYAAYLATREP